MKHITELVAAGCSDGSIKSFCNATMTQCEKAESKLCGAAKRSSAAECTACLADHLVELSAAGCTDANDATFCQSQ